MMCTEISCAAYRCKTKPLYIPCYPVKFFTTPEPPYTLTLGTSVCGAILQTGHC